MLNSSTSTSITTFDIDVFIDFSLLFSPFFVSNIICSPWPPRTPSTKFSEKIKQRRNCLCFALSMASDSFQCRNSHGYRNTATSRTTSCNNCEHREIKNFFLNNSLFPHWNTCFESRGKKTDFGGALFTLRCATVRSLLRPMLDHCLRPMLDHFLRPMLDHCVRPMLDHSLRPMLDHCLRPMLDHCLRPMLDHCLRPMLDHCCVLVHGCMTIHVNVCMRKYAVLVFICEGNVSL